MAFEEVLKGGGGDGVGVVVGEIWGLLDVCTGMKLDFGLALC